MKVPYPCIRSPRFSKKLFCYENCNSIDSRPYPGSYKDYIVDCVDLKIVSKVSRTHYIEVAEHIKKLSEKTVFTLHISNDTDENGIHKIDTIFEEYLYDILNTFNVGQKFIFEFQYKTDDVLNINHTFIDNLKKYIIENDV